MCLLCVIGSCFLPGGGSRHSANNVENPHQFIWCTRKSQKPSWWAHFNSLHQLGSFPFVSLCRVLISPPPPFLHFRLVLHRLDQSTIQSRWSANNTAQLWQSKWLFYYARCQPRVFPPDHLAVRLTSGASNMVGPQICFEGKTRVTDDRNGGQQEKKKNLDLNLFFLIASWVACWTTWVLDWTLWW